MSEFITFSHWENETEQRARSLAGAILNYRDGLTVGELQNMMFLADCRLHAHEQPVTGIEWSPAMYGWWSDELKRHVKEDVGWELKTRPGYRPKQPKKRVTEYHELFEEWRDDYVLWNSAPFVEAGTTVCQEIDSDGLDYAGVRNLVTQIDAYSEVHADDTLDWDRFSGVPWY